jgi:O-antigen ligase
LIYIASLKNPFFARIWSYWSDVKQTSLSDYFEYLGFGARFRYGEAAYATYEAYPILGVGLGNYAFYFPEMMPDRPLAAVPELLRLIVPEGNRERLITPKNFYYRLLAETGLVGMAAFLAFLAAVLGCALFLWLSRDKEQRFWGRAGLLGLVAFLPSAISFDSFAIPNMWVVFGLVTAAAWIYSRQDGNDFHQNGVL